MAITRINNNQITDSVAGNLFVGVNAATKLQDFTVTSGKIANNLTYNSDLTVTGNLTVQGNTTAIDTINLVVEDPLILLAKEQTGAPALDIGFIGKRGTEDNIAFVWDESADQFVAVFTTSEVTNSTININSYASLQVLDLTAANANITGNITFSGNIVGNVTVTGNVDADNLNATTNVTGTTITASGNLEGGNAVITGDVGSATVTATGNVAGGNITTVGNVDGANVNATSGITAGTTIVATGNVTGGNITTAGSIDGANVNATGTVIATGNVSGGNITTAGAVDATGNVSGGNITTAGAVDATGNVSGSNITTAGNVDGANINATANVTGAGAVFSGNVTADTFIGNISGNIDAGGANTNIQFNDDDVLAGSAAFTFDKTSNAVTATGNITGGNLITAGNVDGANVNATSGITAGTTIVATGNVAGGNITTAGAVDATGNVAGGNLTTAGVVTATGNVSGGNITTAGNVDGANVNATSGITAGTTIVATGNVSGGNLTTAGNVDGANINASAGITAGTTVVATGNVSGGNITTAGNVDGANINASADVTATNVIASGNVDGANVNTNSIVGTAITITATSVDMDLTGNLSMSGRYINAVADPVAAQDAATKQYVDDAVSAGLTIHEPVRVAACNVCIGGSYAQGGSTATVTDTIAGNTVVFSSAIDPQVNDQLWFDNSFNGIVGNVPYFVVSAPNTSAAVLTTTYNGSPVANITTGGGLTESVRINSGQGATLTNSGANAALVIDGVTVVATDRVGLFFQTNASTNGVYEVTVPGDVGNAWVLTRSQDMDTYIPDDVNGLDAGDYFYIQEGSAFAGESYVMTAPIGPVIIGYANLTFTQFSASQVYTANTQAGLVLNGTVFSAKVDNDTTAFDGGGNIKVKDGANLVTPNIGNATGNSLTLTGNGLLSATTVTATGNVSGGNLTTVGDVTTATVTASGNIDSANVNATAGITAGTTVTATGNVSGGNITTAGAVDATGNVTGGNLNTAGAVVATGNVTGGNVNTAGTVVATGNIDGGNVNAASAITAGTTITATGNVSGGNLTTAGVVTATGNVSGGNLTTAGVVTATGNVSGGNLTTAGSVDATGNITGGNLSAGSGTISTTGNIDGGNINATANVTGTGAVFSGNVTADTFIGNISGNIDAGGANTDIQFNDDDVLAGSAAFTFDKTSNAVVATGNITGGNLITAGNVDGANVNATSGITAGTTIVATGNVAGGNITTVGNVDGANVNATSGITAGTTIVATGNVTGGNITTAGDVTTATVTATGNISGGNIVTTGTADLGNIRITGDDITNFASNIITINSAGSDIDVRISGDTVPNLLLTDAGTDTVVIGGGNATTGAALKVDTTDSMMVPVGNTIQRPGTPELGMFRFNTGGDALEVYTSSGWEDVGVPAFTVIVADAFVGDGSTLAFTLSQASTTAATIVSINGIVQEPTTAYSVSGTTLTFTEAPAVSDNIDARILTTTTTVTRIENSTASAVVETLTSADVQITGNLLPVANVTYNLGSTAKRWNELWLAGNTIALGNIVIKETSATTIGFFESDGTTPATIDASSVDTTQIASGTSSMAVIAVDGNIRANVDGNTIQTISATGVSITGDLSVTGNATLSGNILGDRVQNGTTSFDIQVEDGNANISVGGVSNVAVFSTTGANITGTLGVSGNVTGGNLITAGLVSLSSITKTGSNGVGNIGSSTSVFDTVFAKATSAQYADLAEMYEADAVYEPGTVLCFGGAKEVTLCGQADSTRVAGVVSTNPSYLMNSGQTGDCVVAVALTGRVPCRVTGTVRKGDLMVSTGDGRARANNAAAVGTVIGKALADFEGADGVIEVVVGRV